MVGASGSPGVVSMRRCVISTPYTPVGGTQDDGIVRLAPDGTTRTFTARLAARLPRDERACRVGRRWHVGNFANATAGEWMAG
jgi:hypothetical protein